MNHSRPINAEAYYANAPVTESKLLTLSEIRNFDKLEDDGHISNKELEDTAICITTINIDLEQFYLYIFGDEHYTRKVKGKKFRQDVIEYKNHYIPDDTISEYERLIGLKLDKYKLIFTITNEIAKETMRDFCDYYNPRLKSFVFKRPLENENLSNCDVMSEIQNNIDIFVTEARKYCSADEILVDTIFKYKATNSKAIRYALELAADYVHKFNNMRLNPITRNLVIKFNWRTDDIWSIIADLGKALPFVTIKTYGEKHKFKCNIKIYNRSQMDTF